MKINELNTRSMIFVVVLVSFLGGVLLGVVLEPVEIVRRVIPMRYVDTQGAVNESNKEVVSLSNESNTQEESGNCSLIACSFDLKNAPSGDRSLTETRVNLIYSLTSEEVVTLARDDLTLEDVMTTLHGQNIWQDPDLPQMLQLWDFDHTGAGSPIHDFDRLASHFLEMIPRIFVEVGVLRGKTSIGVAQLLDKLSVEQPKLSETFVISIDSWLLDLRFMWPLKQQKEPYAESYFHSKRIGGHEMMYFSFLANVINANMTHRIVPLPSTSSNAVYSMIQHGIRPDVVYLDASHANPDIFVDLVGMWTVLRSGGLIILDDYLAVPAIKSSVNSFVVSHADEISNHVCSAQCWLYKS